MNTLAFICVALAIELGGPAIDGGSQVGLSVSEAGRVQSQWNLDEHRAGTYRFSSRENERLILYRLPDPDLTYAMTQYMPTSTTPAAVGSVSFLPAAERIAAIRRVGDGSLISAELIASAAGAPDAAGVTDGVIATTPLTDPATTPDQTPEPEGDIVVTRGGAVLHVEHRGAGILVSLTGLHTQSR